MPPFLFVAPAAAAIDRALAASELPGPILVLGPRRLSRALAQRGRREILASERSPPRRRGSSPALICDERALPIAPHALAGIVGVGLAERGDWRELLAEWMRALAGGGSLVLVDGSGGRARAAELTRRALCAGLSEIEQRHAGRTVVTSGRVTHL